jgi:hypothetical protein
MGEKTTGYLLSGRAAADRENLRDLLERMKAAHAKTDAARKSGPERKLPAPP